MLMARKWSFNVKRENFVFGNPNGLEILPVDSFFIGFIEKLWTRKYS